jgi:hypothetical protein
MQPVARIIVRKLRRMEHLLFGSNPGISTVASVSRCRSQCQEGEITSLFARFHVSVEDRDQHQFIIADKAADGAMTLTISSQILKNFFTDP